MKILLKLIILILPASFIWMFFLLLTEDDSIIGADYRNFALPEFNLEELDESRSIDSSDLGDDYIINVWASWCITCLVEHPFLSQLSEKDIEIVGLNYKDTDSKANAWLQKHGNPYIFSIYDPRGDLAFDLGVTGAPETFLIFDNEIIAHVQGEINQQKWESIFLPLINNNQDQS